MSKIPTIIRREYVTRARSRVFIIVTFLMPLIIGSFALVPMLIFRYGGDTEKIAVVDESKLFVGKLQNQDKLTFGYLNVPYDTLKARYAEKDFTGVLYIPASFQPDKPEGIEYYSNDQLGLGTAEGIKGQVTEVVTRLRLEKVNVTPEIIDQLSESVDLNIVIGEKKGNTGAAAAVGYFSGFLLYILLLIYGMQVMRGVMEEKSSRIAEVIISSVKPFELMIGKIVGIALLGLTQFTVWIVMGVIVVTVLNSMVGDTSGVQESVNQMQQMQPMSGNQQGLQEAVTVMNQSLGQLPIGLIVFGVIFYFLFGYLMYSSLFAAIGAASGDEADQSLTFIATAPIIISFFLAFNAMNAPNSRLSIISSIFPLTSPIVMPARLAYEPDPSEIVLSMVFLILGFLIMVWLAGKIYRTGILMYGKKVSFREMLKWVRY